MRTYDGVPASHIFPYTTLHRLLFPYTSSARFDFAQSSGDQSYGGGGITSAVHGRSKSDHEGEGGLAIGLAGSGIITCSCAFDAAAVAALNIPTADGRGIACSKASSASSSSSAQPCTRGEDC